MDEESLWVTQALRGDQTAFAHLVSAYQVPVYNLCYRMLGHGAEAEDAAQETFVRVYTHLKAYDQQQKLSSWILAVASHYCIDRLRRRRIQWLPLDDGIQGDPLPGNVTLPEHEAMERESAAEVRRLLQALPAEYRLVIALRYWHDLSYAEIAQATGASESAIKSRLHRARQMLADRMIAQREYAVQPAGCIVESGKVTNHAAW